MDMLIKELQDGAAEAKHDEETAQKDYERLMSESQASRAGKADAITSKDSTKADLAAKLETAAEAEANQNEELGNVKQFLSDLHGTCDFLVENFDLRKTARANEVDSLNNAKAE